MLREALDEVAAGSGASGGPSPDQRVFLESISVSGFRGIGRTARLPLNAKPGVLLVAGRNGSGKSGFAEVVGIASTPPAVTSTGSRRSAA